MFGAHGYRGRHRAPSTAGETAAKAAVVGVVGALPLVAAPAAHAGPPGGWGPIVECESGGDPRAENATSTASGLFQFIDGTWRAYGGTEFAPRASGASAAEQHTVAERAYAREGTRPWNASKSCWAGKSAPEPKFEPEAPAPKPAPQPKADRPAAGGYSYVCTPAELRYEECDPADLGETVTDTNGGPRHGSAPKSSPDRGAPARPAAGGTHVVEPGDWLSTIAAAHGVGWRELYAANRDVVGSNPHLILPGQRLVIPG